MNCVHPGMKTSPREWEGTERTGHHHRGGAEARRFAMRSRRRRPFGRLGQEEERAEHKPPGYVAWLVFSPFTPLPQPAGRPAPTLSHRKPPRLRVSAMVVSRALRPLPSR